MRNTCPSQAEILGMPECEVTFPQTSTRFASVVDQAGRNLTKQLNGAPFPNERFEAEIVSIDPDFFSKHRVHPADFCYNRMNRDPISFRLHLFEYAGYNCYRYLGSNFPFEAGIEVRWQPKGCGELVVGRWQNRKCYLRYDPRR